MYDDTGTPQGDVEHGFGAAKHFMPLPNTVVGSHCTWQLRLNTVRARIPGKHYFSPVWGVKSYCNFRSFKILQVVTLVVKDY